MKFEKNKSDVISFWHWFASISNRLAADIQNEDLLNELNAKVEQLDSRLSWEIGPSNDADWCLAISPNLDPKLLPETEAIVANAPSLPNWVFAAARQKKEWDGNFEIEREDGECLSLNSSDWQYVLLRYPDGAHEVLLQSEQAAFLSDNDRWLAAAIVLEGIFGERTLIEKIDKFDLFRKLESKLAYQTKPIAQLIKALSG